MGEKLGKTHSIWTFQVTGTTLPHLTMWKQSSTFHVPLPCFPTDGSNNLRDGGEGGKLMLTEGLKRAIHALNTTGSVAKWGKMYHPGCKGGFYALYFRQANSSLPAWRLMIIKKKSYNCWHYSYPSCTCSKIKKKISCCKMFIIRDIWCGTSTGVEFIILLL